MASVLGVGRLPRSDVNRQNCTRRQSELADPQAGEQNSPQFFEMWGTNGSG
jgi:hypothetical protein